MKHFLIASVLGLFACGSTAAQRPAKTAVATTSTNDGDVVCTDEVSASGMAHRVCHKLLPSSAETGESDMICTDETPTGTSLTKRVCRSQVQKEDDQKLAREIYLNQSARINCNPETMGLCNGQPDRKPK